MSDDPKITLGPGKAVGVDPQHSGLVIMRWPLEPAPDKPWEALFTRGPEGAGWPISLHQPNLFAGALEARCPEDDVTRYVKVLRERVEATNAEYARRIAPELRRQREAQEAEKAESERMVEEAQRRLDELG